MIYTKETDISCGLEENVSKSKMGLFYIETQTVNWIWIVLIECVVDT